MFNGKIHYKSPFSIAMLNYQRVPGSMPFQVTTNIRVIVAGSKLCPFGMLLQTQR